MIFSSQLGRWATVVAVFVVVGAFAGARGLRPALAACSDPDRYWYGTSGNDSKTDNENKKDHWFFLAGADYGRSLACNDPEIVGDIGNDDIGGGSGDDWLEGDAGADYIYGGQGADFMDGGDGADHIYDQEGPATGAPADLDTAYGYANDDTIDVRDGDTYDAAYGGGGTDTCIVDVTAEAHNCER